MRKNNLLNLMIKVSCFADDECPNLKKNLFVKIKSRYLLPVTNEGKYGYLFAEEKIQQEPTRTRVNTSKRVSYIESKV